ncbi:toxin-antitoxin system HicB family antitoxin [Duganella sp. FT50W]|uniref:Toxin-antitoxin system HicB family antitoxin n=2 Tax=Duganella lactea TaxID=2692173 RepID=A0A6L8MGB0_9BURK|nr:toxin-antitoxin system HicB family antitoxin [Duganella lactea]
MRPFDASGRIALRIPRSLHADIAELAQSQGCSVNQLLTVAISEYVGKLGLPQAGVGLISK